MSEVRINIGPLITEGFKLMKKPNKTAVEEEAAKTFKKILQITLTVTLIAFALLGASVFYLIGSFHTGITRYGTVIDDENIRIIKDETIIMPLKELNINPNEVNIRDRIVLLYDSRDEVLLEAIPKAIYDKESQKRLNVLIATFVICVVGLVVTSRILHKKIGKKYYDWYYSEPTL